MRKISLVLLTALTLVTSEKTYCFFNPADTAALLEILATTIKQLMELRSLVRNTEEQLDLYRDVNSGIDETINTVETVYPNKAIDLYKDWQSVNQADDKLKAIYGAVVKSKGERAQKDLDLSVIDAILQNNQTVSHSDKIDQLGEMIIERSSQASPKGAARLSAEALGVGLQVQNQSLRIQASQLRLQAQKYAMENMREKEETKAFMDSSKNLKKAMSDKKDNYVTPRFQ